MTGAAYSHEKGLAVCVFAGRRRAGLGEVAGVAGVQELQNKKIGTRCFREVDGSGARGCF